MAMLWFTEKEIENKLKLLLKLHLFVILKFIFINNIFKWPTVKETNCNFANFINFLNLFFVKEIKV